MKTYVFVHEASGLVRAVITQAADLPIQNVDGLVVHEAPGPLPNFVEPGRALAWPSLEVVDYQPPAPPEDEMRSWIWDGAARRWVDQPTLAARKAARMVQLSAAIEVHEQAQARPMRELLQALVEGQPVSQQARTQLDSVAATIAALRAQWRAVAAAASDDDLDRIQMP